MSSGRASRVYYQDPDREAFDSLKCSKHTLDDNISKLSEGAIANKKAKKSLKSKNEFRN